MSGWVVDKDFGLLVRGLAASHEWHDMERHMSRASPLLQQIVRAATNAETLTAHPYFADVLAPFVLSLGADSIFDRVLADGAATVMSYRAVQANVSLSVVTAHQVGEGEPKPVSNITFGGTVERNKSATILVASDDLMREPTTPEAFRKLLRESIAAGTNAGFLALLAAAGDTIAAAGTTSAQIAATVTAAKQAIGRSARTKFYLAVSPDTFSLLEGTTTTTGAIAFPEVPNGSLIGCTLMMSDSLKTSPPSAVLFDAGRLALGDNGPKLSPTRHASLEMSDTPTGSSAAHSLWQRNEQGLRVERMISVGYGGDTSSGVPSVTITSAW